MNSPVGWGLESRKFFFDFVLRIRNVELLWILDSGAGGTVKHSVTANEFITRMLYKDVY